MILLGTTLMVMFTVMVTGAPRSSVIYADDKVQNYLMKFGYLPQTDLETGNLRTDDQLTDAIEHLQRFSGIPVTGIIDEDTVRLMRLPRCGLPDKMDKMDPRYARIRHKRFTIHGQHWLHRNLTWR
ncbi:matrix metalloproteinase-2-like [Frieseomelitta varia]|uniref:matrix metalloproteinase-2-like n=1 Tax=Frieseomelitta varia TaxID=561572 RepID=UPI001CB69340|nr:matrix metalloproteinase-2-like [Frieseomelitta varia]